MNLKVRVEEDTISFGSMLIVKLLSMINRVLGAFKEAKAAA